MWFPVLVAFLVLAISGGGKCNVNTIKLFLLINSLQALEQFFSSGAQPTSYTVGLRESFPLGKAAMA